MAMTKRLGAYADIQAAFNAALEHDGGTLTFTGKGKATNWRQRAYYYRQLLGTSNPEYDGIQLRQDECVVKISLVKLDAKFTTPEGKAVVIDMEPDPPLDADPEQAVDPLLADAMDLVRTTKGAS